MNKPIITQYADTLYSCLIPYEMHLEYRMPNHSLIYVRSGKLHIEEGAEKTEVEAGSYVFIRRDCNVRLMKESLEGEPYQGICLALQRQILKEYYSQLTDKPPREMRPVEQVATILPATVPLKSLFLSLAVYADNGQAPEEIFLRIKVREAILCLLQANPGFYPTLFDFNEAWKIDLLGFMEQNYTQDMSLEEFASYTGRSLATFKRDFARVSPVSPGKWIVEHRLDRARQLITEEGKRAVDVYLLVGFKNRSHFFTAYKKRFGHAPSAYV